MAKKEHGRTRSGQPLTDELLERLAGMPKRASISTRSFVDGVGNPAINAASFESVQLDPKLSRALNERAEREGRTNSELIQEALRRYLEASWVRTGAGWL